MDSVSPKVEGSAKHLQKKLTLMCGLVLAATGSQYAAAQEEGESALAIEEVIVTSRKRQESIQDVPIAVTSITNQLDNPAI